MIINSLSLSASPYSSLSSSAMSNYVIPWTVTTRLLCPWKFPNKDHWHGLPFSSPEIFPIQDQTISLLPRHLLPLRHHGIPLHRYSVYSYLLPQFFYDCNYSGPHFLSPGLEQWMPTCFPFSIS